MNITEIINKEELLNLKAISESAMLEAISELEVESNDSYFVVSEEEDIFNSKILGVCLVRVGESVEVRNLVYVNEESGDFLKDHLEKLTMSKGVELQQ